MLFYNISIVYHCNYKHFIADVCYQCVASTTQDKYMYLFHFMTLASVVTGTHALICSGLDLLAHVEKNLLQYATIQIL